MIPSPLHPAVVHFPIVLMIGLPFVAVGALIAIRRGTAVRTAWAVTAAVAVLLAVSAWTAVQTGALQENQVEQVVPRPQLHEHQEAGQSFMFLSLLTAIVIVVGLVPGRVGSAARIVGTLTAAGLVVSGWQVGRSGGALVYEYGAASAYTQAAAPAGQSGGGVAVGGEQGEEGEGGAGGILGAIKGALGGDEGG